MIYYIAVLTYTHLLYLFRNFHGLILFFLTLPIWIFGALRGSSGKDTPLYFIRFLDFEFTSSNFFRNYEPAIEIFIGIGRLFSQTDPVMFFFFHAMFLSGLHVLLLKRSSSTWLFLLTFGPVFLIDGIVNGMRSSILYFLFLVYAASGKRLFLISSLTAHVSSLSLLGYEMMRKKPWRLVLSWLFLVVAFFTLFPMLENLVNAISSDFERFDSKLRTYTNSSGRSFYSGLADTLTLLGILFLLVLKSNIRSSNSLIMVFFFILVMTNFILIQESIAFLRFQKLTVVMVFAWVFSITDTSGMSRLIPASLGFFYTANFLRQVIYDYGFLPYGGMYW